MMKKRVLWPMIVLLCMACAWVQADEIPFKIGKFGQEVAARFTVEDGLPSENVYAVMLGEDGAVYASTEAGLARFDGGKWGAVPVMAGNHPAMHAAWVGQMEAMREAVEADGQVQPVMLPTPDFPAADYHGLLYDGEHYYIAREDGLYRETPGEGDAPLLPGAPAYQAVRSPEGSIAAATEDGLFVQDEFGDFAPVQPMDELGRKWFAGAVRGVAYDARERLWVASRAGVGCREESGWTFYTGDDGLPYNEFTCVAAAPDGALWFGTRMGAIRFEEGKWHYRQGKTWLPDDRVRNIVVDADGAAWFATPGGVGRIAFKPMTLREKAQFYEAEIEKYIKRTKWGYTSEVGLPEPGVKRDVIYHDSDNDGLWTGMYGAGECFGYAATGDPALKENARQAFEALRFLQKVTQGAGHSPPKGYVARTVLPISAPDPNIGRVERDREKRATDDALWKVYEPRWPKSADGEWYFKTDTSSDELDGHYFFYPAYYDLAAETEEEKARVREVVRDLTDHLVEHGFYLMDHDGTPTRWAVYAPEALNQDRNWWPERGLKSLSIMSYLTVAEHVTGDPKYGDIARDLAENFGYRHNAMWYKVHFGIGSGNQSDDEMAFMCFYNLLKYTKNEKLRQEMLYSFYSAWMVEQPEMNPFFNFCFAAFGRDATYNTPWGVFPIQPWEGWLADSMTTLKGFPLDRIGWAHKNSHRLDIQLLPRQQQVEPYEPGARTRGYRVNGKVLPVENRHFNHWNTDPWRLDYGGNGTSLASGTVYLLPYYMGLYHGFIEETE